MFQRQNQRWETKDWSILCRPYVDLFTFDTSVVLPFYSDASKKDSLGFGVYFNRQWAYGTWEPGYIKNCDPSIEYLELFALCVGIFIWQEQLRDCQIIIHCDNQAVINMVNQTTSSCKNCMMLLRLLVLNGLIYNRRVLVKYIKSKKNILADSLSHQKFEVFWKHAPANTKRFPERLPPMLWLLSKLWIH